MTRSTHTLMESCWVEEFLLSAETEGIWGFTKAMEMVGGVSLFIFFSGFKHLKQKKNSSCHVSCSFFQHLSMKIPTKSVPTVKTPGKYLLEKIKT